MRYILGIRSSLLLVQDLDLRKSNTHQRNCQGSAALPVPNRQSRGSQIILGARKDMEEKFSLSTANKQKLKNIKNGYNSCLHVA